MKFLSVSALFLVFLCGNSLLLAQSNEVVKTPGLQINNLPSVNLPLTGNSCGINEVCEKPILTAQEAARLADELDCHKPFDGVDQRVSQNSETTVNANNGLECKTTGSKTPSQILCFVGTVDCTHPKFGFFSLENLMYLSPNSDCSKVSLKEAIKRSLSSTVVF